MIRPRTIIGWTLLSLAASLLLFYAVLTVARSARAELRTVDGDTIVLNGERVRVAYLDCPEMGHRGGQEAKFAMARLLRGGIELKPRPQATPAHPRCQRPGYCDRFGRTVASVYANGRDVARRLIASGTCREYCRFSKSADFPQGKYGTCQ